MPARGSCARPACAPVLLPDFQPWAILGRLNAAEVDYVVIGGIAAVIHGSAQFTQDLDVCYSTEPDNLDRLGRALIDLEGRLRGVAEDVPFVPDGRSLRRVQVLTLDTPLGPFDVLASPSGYPGYQELAARAMHVEREGLHFRVASLEDLIAMKQAAGRPKDLIAVEELEAIQRILRDQA